MLTGMIGPGSFLTVRDSPECQYYQTDAQISVDRYDRTRQFPDRHRFHGVSPADRGCGDADDLSGSVRLSFLRLLHQPR